MIDFHGDTKAKGKPKRRPILEFAVGRSQLHRVLYEDYGGRVPAGGEHYEEGEQGSGGT